MSDKVFNILQNANGMLMAENLPPTGHGFEYGTLFVGVILVIASFFITSARTGFDGALLACVGAWSFSREYYPSFGMTLNQQAQTISTESMRNGKTFSLVTVGALEIAPSERQFIEATPALVIVK